MTIFSDGVNIDSAHQFAKSVFSKRTVRNILAHAYFGFFLLICVYIIITRSNACPFTKTRLYFTP